MDSERDRFLLERTVPDSLLLLRVRADENCWSYFLLGVLAPDESDELPIMKVATDDEGERAGSIGVSAGEMDPDEVPDVAVVECRLPG